VNQEYARFLGPNTSAVVGRTVAEVIGQAAFDVIRPYGDRAMAGDTVRWEGRLPYADGQRFVQRVCMTVARRGRGGGRVFRVRARSHAAEAERGAGQEITARRRVWVGVRDADEEALVQVADSGPGVP
jgi:hypothetical protein